MHIASFNLLISKELKQGVSKFVLS